VDPERWQRIQELFDAALPLGASERADFLDRACASDADLRSELATLLRLHDGDPAFLEEPASPLPIAPGANPQVDLREILKADDRRKDLSATPGPAPGAAPGPAPGASPMAVPGPAPGPAPGAVPGASRMAVPIAVPGAAAGPGRVFDPAIQLETDPLQGTMVGPYRILQRLGDGLGGRNRVNVRVFGGLTTDETAEVLQVAPMTVKRAWLLAKAWIRRMRREIDEGDAGEGDAGEREAQS
jgi:hypothetical protein